MMEMDGAETKPLADIRRRKYDETSRRKSLGGRTARRRIQDGSVSDAQLARTREASCARNNEYAYLGDGKSYVARPACQLTKPFVITDFELDGHDVNYSLDRSGAWEHVQQVLAKHSVTPPCERKLSDGRVATCYRLEPTHSFMPDAPVAAAESALRTRIYEIRRHRPKLWRTLTTAPPDDVKAPLLKARLHCAGCFGSAAHQLMNAVVRCNDSDAAWRISRSFGKPLDIDLGTTCRIDAFATQGRAPATRIYPHVGYDPLMGEHTVEDAEYLTKAPGGKSVRYGGPWWRVLSTPYDGLPSWKPGAYHEPAWCSRYELLWRAAGGRQWNSLGRFDGNSDETTEVAHSFTNVGGGGLRARYLRVVPLECVGGGAMRVGVYGEHVGNGASGQVVRGGGRRSSRRRAESDEDECDLVEYELTRRAGPKRGGYVHDGSELAYDYWAWWNSTKKSNLRLRRRLAARREVAEVMEDKRFGRDADSWSYADFFESRGDDDYEELDEGGAAPVGHDCGDLSEQSGVAQREVEEASESGSDLGSDSGSDSGTCLSYDVDGELDHDWQLIEP